MLKNLLIVTLFAFLASPCFAWKYASNVTIVELMTWEDLDDSGPLHFKLSDNTWCYVPSGKKTLHSLIMSLYISGKQIAEIHCYDTPDSRGAHSAHKLHRIIAK